jgi:hypothetical protein
MCLGNSVIDTIRKPPVEAAGAVDAENAPTAPWKTRRRVSHSYHRHAHRESETEVLPMFPVNFVTYVPGCSAKGASRLKRNPLNIGCGGPQPSLPTEFYVVAG